MLRELHITNLAVIQDACIELGEGLNCFTGQTGAGKSLVMGALEILLGLRAAGGADVLRPGASEARISGVFEVRDPWLAGEISRTGDLPIGRGDQLLISRKLFASGRSSASVNGQPVTAPMLGEVGQLLVDVHGRHDQQYLLKPSNQLMILDLFGQLTVLRERFAELHNAIRSLEKQRSELLGSQSLVRQQLELYRFQADEIDAVAPVAGEFNQLKARHKVLGHLQRIKRDTAAGHAALDDRQGSILEQLHVVGRVLDDVAELDPHLTGLADQVRAARLSLQDAAFELGRYAERLEVSPDELSQVEDRLNALNRLLSKYASQLTTGASRPGGPGRVDGGDGDDPVAAIIQYRCQIDQELQRLGRRDEDLGQIQTRIDELAHEMQNIGQQLSRKRRSAAATLKPLVEDQLRELGMDQVRFEVAFDSQEGPAEPTAAAGPTGLDRVEMLVQTNPGQPARPLRKIASSGELSRIMLAIKSILAHSDRVSVLVFDEIDANIGGRMGTVIGQKLRQLARSSRTSDGSCRGHQVLCITHLPQIAAFADRHLHIAKAVHGRGKARQTRTTVSVLEGPSRVNELAEMLTGKSVTDTTRRQVRELLASASQ